MRSVRDTADITVDSIVLGMLSNNVYYVSDGTSGLLVDPSCKPDEIVAWLAGRPVDAIVLTHYHFDHIGAACALRARYSCPVYASAADALWVEHPDEAPGWRRKIDACTVDVRVEDGDVVSVGAMAWRVLLTPGHSPGSMCLYSEPRSECDTRAADGPDGLDASGASDASEASAALDAPRGILLSGDTLFCGGIGRTDFDGGNPQAMDASLARLAELPDSTDVFPGHGAFTTIAAERCVSLGC